MEIKRPPLFEEDRNRSESNIDRIVESMLKNRVGDLKQIVLSAPSRLRNRERLIALVAEFEEIVGTAAGPDSVDDDE